MRGGRSESSLISSSSGSRSRSRSRGSSSSGSSSTSRSRSGSSRTASAPREDQNGRKSKPPDEDKTHRSRVDIAKQSKERNHERPKESGRNDTPQDQDDESDVFSSRSSKRSDVKIKREEAHHPSVSSVKSHDAGDKEDTPNVSVVSHDEGVCLKNGILTSRSGKENTPLNSSTPRKQFIVPTSSKQQSSAEKVKQYLVQLPHASKRLPNGVPRLAKAARVPPNPLSCKSTPLKSASRTHAWEEKPPGYRPGSFARTNLVGRLGPQVKSSPVRTPLVHQTQSVKPVARRWRPKRATTPPKKRDSSPPKQEDKPALTSNNKTKPALASNSKPTRSGLFSRAHYPQRMQYSQPTTNKLLIESRVPRCLQQFPVYTRQPLRQSCIYNPWGSVSFSNKHIVRSCHLPHPRKDRPSSAPPKMQTPEVNKMHFTKPEIAMSYTLIPQEESDGEDALNNNGAYHYTYDGGRDTPVVYEQDEDEPPQDVDENYSDDALARIEAPDSDSESEKGDNSDEEEGGDIDEDPGVGDVLPRVPRPKSAFPTRRHSVSDTDDEVPEEEHEDARPVNGKQPVYNPVDEEEAEEIVEET